NPKRLRMTIRRTIRPNKLVTKFILEKEALTPAELIEKIDKVLVANFF
ncbi:MAG: hypothetical protein JWN78_2727, partial [Bacteroidota bacterium]|nr:hypothetical protein [Bacteroidota bacterium]